jgi:hypothetical protein
MVQYNAVYERERMGDNVSAFRGCTARYPLYESLMICMAVFSLLLFFFCRACTIDKISEGKERKGIMQLR